MELSLNVVLASGQMSVKHVSLYANLKSPTKPRFIILVFPGTGETPEVAARIGRWPEVAVEQNVVVAIMRSDDRFWAHSHEATRLAVPHLRAMIAERLQLDSQTPLVATGFSAGGLAVVDLACAPNSAVSAVAIVSTLFYTEQVDVSCQADVLPVLHIWDPNDEVYFLDAVSTPEREILFDAKLGMFASVNQCEYLISDWPAEWYPPEHNGTARCAQFESCQKEVSRCFVHSPDGVQTEFSVVNEFASVHHYWNGPEDGFDTTAAIISFYERVLR